MHSYIKFVLGAIMTLLLLQQSQATILGTKINCYLYPLYEKINSATNGYSQFEKDVLHQHNKIRYEHGVQPVTLNRTISNSAKAWAQRLFNENRFYHPTTNIYGQNLYNRNVDVNRVSGSDVVDLWYAEEKLYKYDGTFSKQTGHFTQLVWKASLQIGVAIVGSSARGSYVVVEYYPRGNVLGSFDQNVAQKQRVDVKCSTKN